MSPTVLPERSNLITLPLNEQFRFSHEPISRRVDLKMFIRQEQLRDLQTRIRYSTGGAFLITGFRGVGKTSFVNKALEAIEDSRDGGKAIRILPIAINLSRRMNATEVMHHIIRQIYTELDRKGLYRRLPKKFRHLIEMAYQRTAYAMSYNREKTTGQEGSLSPIMTAFNIGWSGSRSQSEGQSMEFLGYDDKSAEYDVIRIMHELNGGYRTWRRKWIEIRPVIVFDEIDKLDLTGAEDRRYLLELVGTLKGVLTTSGCIFLFVGGKDMYRAWLEETLQPDSIYESVFAYDLYLPCMWDLPSELMRHFIQMERASPVNPIASATHIELPTEREESSLAYQAREKLTQYLAYKGRGIARRTIRELNRLIQWHESRLQVVLDPQAWDQVRLLSTLQEQIKTDLKPFLETLSRNHAQYDELMQTAYYIFDHILETDGIAFGREDLIQHFSKQRFYENNRFLGEIIYQALQVLLKIRYIEPFRERTAIMGDAPTQVRYQLHKRVYTKLKTHRQAGDGESAIPPQFPYGGTIRGFVLLSTIAQGGVSEVYLAKQGDQEYALKLMRRIDNPNWQRIARALMLREATILRANYHPNIVKLHANGNISGDLPNDDTVSYLVIEYINGFSLQTLIQESLYGLQTEQAIALFRAVCEPVMALREAGLYRLDLKPDNFLMDVVRERLVLIDVGTGLYRAQEDNPPELWTNIGTKGFIAPELRVSDGLDLDPDHGWYGDIYALGVILYLLLVGKSGMIDLENEITPPIEEVNDPAMRTVLAKAFALAPRDRYPTIEAFLSALIPEQEVPLASVVIRERNTVRNQGSRSAETATIIEVIAPPAKPILPRRPIWLFHRSAINQSGSRWTRAEQPPV